MLLLSRLKNYPDALTWLAAALAVILALSACRHALAPAEPVAAVLEQPVSAADKQQLRAAIKQLSGRSNFLLSDQVFNQDNSLYLEKHQRRDQNGLLLMGAHNDFPDVFLLEQRGKRCWLRHAATQQSVALNLPCSKLAP